MQHDERNNPDAATKQASMFDIQLVDMQTLCAITRFSRSTIYKLIHDGSLPKPMKPGGGHRHSRWLLMDIKQAIEKMRAESMQCAAQAK